MSTPDASLASSSRPSTPASPAQLSDYLGLSHAPHSKEPCIAKPMSIKVTDERNGSVRGFLHLPPTATGTPASDTAAILLSGAGGGIVGPSSIYLSLADKLASLAQPIPTLRLDYRYPARSRYCVRDVLSAMDELQSGYGIKKFVLVGWSFGGTPVFCIGGSDRRVVGCATIASQTSETEGVKKLSPIPLLLLHGTSDRTLSKGCSELLFERYGNDGDRQLHLFPGDNHALTKHSLEAEQLIGAFILKCAGIKAEKRDEAVLAEKLVNDEEKLELMKKGGDLRHNESIS